MFLVDTYNVLKSGVPNAIRVAREMVAEKGIRPRGIRLDSGDIAYLSIEARKMLDEGRLPGYGDHGVQLFGRISGARPARAGARGSIRSASASA